MPVLLTGHMTKTTRTMRGVLGAAAVLAFAVAGAAVARSGDPTMTVSAFDGAAPETSSLAPLKLRPGNYTYVVRDIGSEITTVSDEQILERARLGPQSRWDLSFRSDGRWVERSREGNGSIERSFDGERKTTSVDNVEQEVPAEAPEADADAAKASGSSIPEGGPRLEFNPYGASFVLHLARASALDGKANGLTASETTDSIECGARMCSRTTVSRSVAEPEPHSEYLRSLPWGGDNIERTTVVFEPKTQIIHSYVVTFDDVTLHEFHLEDYPA